MEQINDWNGHDRDGPGTPMDLGFDFESFFDRVFDRQLSKSEQNHFAMRLMGMFCRDFWKNENPADVPVWVMKYFADQFFKVLAGEKWNDAFPLPWHAADPVRSRAEEQELNIFCDVANLLKDFPETTITGAIQEIADVRHVSFETARAAWYKLRKNLPDGFLKKASQI